MNFIMHPLKQNYFLPHYLLSTCFENVLRASHRGCGIYVFLSPFPGQIKHASCTLFWIKPNFIQPGSRKLGAKLVLPSSLTLTLTPTHTHSIGAMYWFYLLNVHIGISCRLNAYRNSYVHILHMCSSSFTVVNSGPLSTLTHQQPCAVVSSVSTIWSSHGQTEPCPNCVCFSSCSPPASTSAAVPRLRPLQVLLLECIYTRMQYKKYYKYEGRASLL